MSRLLWTGFVVTLAVAGCQAKTEPVVVLRPTVAWEDIASQPVEATADGFINLVPQGTDGVFPAAIAVARVTLAPAEGDDTQDGGQPSPTPVVLDMTPANDFLPWNSLFDSLQYVRDTFPLHGHDLSGEAPTPARLAAAANRLRAGLCLVYSAGDLSESDSRVRGLIYDARTGRPLATIEARASVPDPESVPHPPELVDDDLRYCDPRFLVNRRFEQLVFDCVRELKSRDRAVPPQREEGWIPEQPLEPRTWPPVIGIP